MTIQKRLQSKEFVVLAEMNTPKGVDISRFVTDARRIKGRIDGIVVPDMDNGVMRMSALAGGVLVQQQGLEAVIHVYGRDRNRMALQGDLLAAHVLGIQNLIVVHGDDMANSDHRMAVSVDDLDELGLLAAIRSLRDGKDLAGFDLDGQPEFNVGCRLAPFADEAAMNSELDLAKEKIAAGASFIVTPPVFDINRFQNFMQKASILGVPVIPMVFLIKSVAVARYIATNEPGAHISEELIRRIRKSQDREMEGVKIAGETISQLRKTAQGVLIQAMGWEHRLSAILDAAGI
ncbi:MAG: 5,10-methylenetetrahydrofolate reductase [Desulfobacteraceae bacterium]|nr:MAG: 5,10-methylenetetrahydrofolate reductase [Desulfobacteraceae bacterium]